MKSIFIIIFLLFSINIFCTPIKELPLDSRNVITIYVGFKKTPCTLMFPSAITAIFSQGCVPVKDAAKIEKQKGKGKPRVGLVYDFTPGTPFITIWAKREGARGSFNLIYNNDTYVFVIVESQEKYYSSVTFRESGFNSNGLGSSQSSIPRHAVIGFIEEAKTYQILKHNNSAVSDIEYFKPKKPILCPFTDFNVKIVEVFKYNRHDTLVFNTVFENKSKFGIKYDPYKVAVQLGSIRMPVTAIKSPGVIPPQAAYPVWFGIANTRRWSKGPPLAATNNDWFVHVITDNMIAKSKYSTIPDYLNKRTEDIFEKILVTDKIDDLEKLGKETIKLNSEINTIKGQYKIKNSGGTE